ncbi:MAG: ABC transporter permease subunit [Bacilli bacterium]|nr:ABC transporter permease subunit [Bacilli bacterium]
MNLLFKDMKEHLKSVIIWILVLALLIIMIITLHPIAVEKMDMMDEMMEQFPPEMIKALNLTNLSFQNILDYFFYEFQFILLASTIFAGILGASLIGKEESDKTIQFLYAKPISRTNILLTKMIVAGILLIFFNITLFIISALGMTIFSNQNIDYLLLFNIFMGQLLIQITFTLIGFMLAVLIPKPKSAPTIMAGITMVTFILGIMSKIADKVANLAYISPIHYLLSDDFISIGYLKFKHILIMVIICIISTTVAFLNYKKKNFNL